MRLNIIHILFIMFFIINITGESAKAVPLIYTDSNQFMADLYGDVKKLNFDNQYPNIISSGDTIDGITFDYNIGGVNLAITDGSFFGNTINPPWASTSPPFFLGTDDGDVFMGGDIFNLSFNHSNAIGMFFISADPLFNNDIMLTAGGLTAGIDVNNFITLYDDSSAFFLGIIDNESSFTSAKISSIGEYFFYNVDDIITSPISAVPEPATIILYGSGIGIASVIRRRKSQRFV